MARGFFSGVIWGGVVAVAGLATVSQMLPQPGPPPGQSPASTAAAVPGDLSALDGVEAPAPAVPAPTEPPVAQKAVPDPVAASEPAPETASAPVTDPAGPAPNKAAPAEVETAEPKPTTPAQAALPPPASAPPPAAPDQPAAQQSAPATPESPQTETAQDNATPPAAASLPPQKADAPTVVPEPKAQVTAEAPPPGPVAALPAPQLPRAEVAPGGVELPPPPPLDPEEEALLVPAPEPAAPPPPALIVPDPTPPPEAAQDQDGEGTARLPTDDGLDRAVDGVTVGRLPTITAPAAEAAPGTTSGAETADAAPPDDRPLARFARSFDNPAAKPLFAILLVDPGGDGVERGAFASLPFPVSFVIDPLDPGAAEAARIYRAAGQEVAMLATGIPQGATAADLEQTFQAHAATLPEALAVVDLPDGGFQQDRPLASQVVPIIASQGRGLVTFDRGLNAADQVARRAEAPSASIFRILDGEGEDAAAMRRLLDRAAFRAAQQGRVTVIGSARPETVAVLLEWAVEGRATSVALAPLSAVMSAD